MRNWKNWVFAFSMAVNVAVLVYLATGAGTRPILMNSSYAQTRAITSGQYAAATAHITTSRAPLFLVDNRAKKMMVYSIGPTMKRDQNNMEVMGIVDLTQQFGKDLAGDVVMLPGDVTGEFEAVYVIDAAGKRVVAYAAKGKEIVYLGHRDLEKDFEAVSK